jgi:L1 cell adhesion molecule like protein
VSRAIGIDLGTTYSCVSVWENDEAKIIPNGQGNSITPSCVAFNDKERLIGSAASGQVDINPMNTVFDVKRLIGRKFSDKYVQEDINYWPYTVVNGTHDKPQIVVQYKGEVLRLAAEEISAMVLGYMKEISETYLGHNVYDAVITVPAYFNDQQRQATMDAGLIAGLNVLRIVNEPSATAIAYGLNKNGLIKNVLIFDLGGGTFDISLLVIDDGVIEIKATYGDTHLGGVDFDNRLIEHAVEIFMTQTGYDIRGSPRSLARLRKACERAKRTLSQFHGTSIEINSLFKGEDLCIKLSRAKFEELNIDLFKKCIIPLEKVLQDGKINPLQVDDIVLVGGSSRIPKVQELLSEYFNGMELIGSMNPDEVVANGAAIYAAVLTNSKYDDIILRDITSHSVGFESNGGIMKTLIPRNSLIPSNKSQPTVFDYDLSGDIIKVFEGERKMTDENNFLGTIEHIRFSSLDEITFNVDLNGILRVLLNKSSRVMITNESGRLTKEDIIRMIKDSEKFAEDDKKMAIIIKNRLENYVVQVRNSIEDRPITYLKEMEIITANVLIEDITLWLDLNQNNTKNNYSIKITEFDEKIMPIMAKIDMYKKWSARNASKYTP